MVTALKKYKLTGETKRHNGCTLHRIQALIDIPEYSVHAGDFGGWVESEDNLRHEGKCWVGGDAMVYNNAMVYGSAFVHGKATVNVGAEVSGAAQIARTAYVTHNAKVYGTAYIHSDAVISGDARVYGSARLGGSARVSASARVCGNAKVLDDAAILGNAKVCGYALVGNKIALTGSTWEESPVYIKGTKYNVYSRDKQTVTIGCQTYAFDKWRTYWKAISRRCNEQDAAFLEEYRQYFNVLVKLYGDGITIDSLD